MCGFSSPPFLWPCYFGTDIPEREQLIAYNRSIEDIRQILGADSLGYLRVERLSEMVEGRGICTGCFTGKYPMASAYGRISGASTSDKKDKVVGKRPDVKMRR